MNDYIYAICRYDSRECSEIWLGLFGPPDVVGLFSENQLGDATTIVEDNATDIFEGCYDFIAIEKVPLGTLYFSGNIEERHIYHYNADDTYKLVGILKGREVINFETDKVVKRFLEDAK